MVDYKQKYLQLLHGGHSLQNIYEYVNDIITYEDKELKRPYDEHLIEPLKKKIDQFVELYESTEDYTQEDLNRLHHLYKEITKYSKTRFKNRKESSINHSNEQLKKVKSLSQHYKNKQKIIEAYEHLIQIENEMIHLQLETNKDRLILVGKHLDEMNQLQRNYHHYFDAIYDYER